MRQGIRLGIDVGTARIGVAQSDLHGILASPVETISRQSEWLARLIELCADIEPVEVYVGLPVNLRGEHTMSTNDAVAVARELAAAISAPVLMLDERLTTTAAHQQLRSSGKKQHQTRSVIDQVAAVMLVQHALDSETNTGTRAGTPIADLEE